ncbi:hypothetical protein ACOSQ4_020532 [Xanthoceras sorbifolium]
MEIDALPEISFHAMSGTMYPQMIRVMGKLRNKEIIMLVDGGSTHNFIDQTVAEKFGLPIIRDKKFQIMAGNKERIECTSRYLALTFMIQGHPVQADFYILPVTACQAILGVQWLETLGPIEMDYKQLTMSFKHKGYACTFHRFKQNELAPISDKELLHLSGKFFFFLLQIVPAHTPPDPLAYRRIYNYFWQNLPMCYLSRNNYLCGGSMIIVSHYSPIRVQLAYDSIDMLIIKRQKLRDWSVNSYILE